MHAEGFDHPVRAEDVVARLQRHSLGWVCATGEEAELLGFVNVAWDGGTHAFLLDTLVAAAHRRRGIGRDLVRTAADHARDAGCAWLHVDFEAPLRDFYVRSCGFSPTSAGLVALWGGVAAAR
nr:GNAT family N-acetyltransferase [Kineococcus siccus]